MESLEFWERKRHETDVSEGCVVPEEQMYALLVPALDLEQDELRRCYIGLWMNFMNYRRLRFVTMTEADVEILYGIAKKLAVASEEKAIAEVIELGRLTA